MAADGFRSADHHLRYLALYDEVRALTPPPDVAHDVPTKFGTVRVYQHGPAGGVPIVLIHGFFLTSAMWWGQVEGLAGEFTVYTIDMLGQPGASVQTRAMLDPADCVECIDATLSGLGLRDVHLVGHSYGGWLATHTAARAPGRLATVTLVDPAHTVARLSIRFWRSLAVLISRPHSVRAERAAAWVTGYPVAGSSIDALTRLFSPDSAPSGRRGGRHRCASLLVEHFARYARQCKSCWRATVFTVPTTLSHESKRWCRRGRFTCRATPHTRYPRRHQKT